MQRIIFADRRPPGIEAEDRAIAGWAPSPWGPRPQELDLILREERAWQRTQYRPLGAGRKPIDFLPGLILHEHYNPGIDVFLRIGVDDYCFGGGVFVRPSAGKRRQGTDVRLDRGHILIAGRGRINRYVAGVEVERDCIGITVRDHKPPAAVIVHGAPTPHDRPADQTGSPLEVVGCTVPYLAGILDPPRLTDRERPPHRRDEPIGIHVPGN